MKRAAVCPQNEVEIGGFLCEGCVNVNYAGSGLKGRMLLGGLHWGEGCNELKDDYCYQCTLLYKKKK